MQPRINTENEAPRRTVLVLRAQDWASQSERWLDRHDRYAHISKQWQSMKMPKRRESLENSNNNKAKDSQKLEMKAVVRPRPGLERRWESMSCVTSPQKPVRRETPQEGRRKLLQAAKQWESSSSVASPQKPRRQRSNENLEDVFFAKMILPLSLAKTCDSRRSKMMSAARWESTSSMTSSSTVRSPSKPQRQNSSEELLAQMSSGVTSLRGRKILASRKWESMRIHSSTTMNRTALMEEAQRWDSVSSDLTLPKPIRRLSNENPSTPVASPRPLLSNTKREWTSSTSLLSTPASTRARKLVSSRAWQSFLDKKNAVPTKKAPSSTLGQYPSTPPFQITITTESTQKSVEKIQSLRKSLKHKRDALASTVQTHRKSLARTTSRMESERADTNKNHTMDAQRVLLMSKFKALNKGMGDALVQKRQRLAQFKSINAEYARGVPPAFSRPLCTESISECDVSDDEETIETQSLSGYSSITSSTETGSNIEVSYSSNGSLPEGTLPPMSAHNSGLAEYISSSNLMLKGNRPTVDDRTIPSLPDLMSIKQDDEDISEHFDGSSSSVESHLMETSENFYGPCSTFL